MEWKELIMTSATKDKTNGAPLDFEQQLWAMADEMRGHMDPSEYKHIALGLIFLKYISDSFEGKFEELSANPAADPEDRDEYIAENIFWVHKNARWDNIKANAPSANIKKIIDDAMISIEKENPSLKGVLPKEYSRPGLDKRQLAKLINLISTISMKEQGQKDVLGRVYEYFLSRFAGAEGKGGGEFYTPQSVVQLLVEMLEPYEGRVYDPCCGSGGMFVQSEKFVEEHGGRIGDISIYGQESNFTTWRLCKMNLAIRGIDCNVGEGNADTFHNDVHKDLKADFILANPPFNIKAWGGERLRDDMRWKYGAPPAGNANFAWIQHIAHHLAPHGVAGFVLANGSMSSTASGEGEIRQHLIEDNLVDCMVALPGQLFYSTSIPVCLWFLANDRSNGLVKHSKLRDRRGEILFIDARKLGFMADRTHRAFDAQKDIGYIADAYHSWRGEEVEHEVFKGGYQDIAGFCKSASLEEVEKNGFVLTPGRYVGAEDELGDGVPFGEKFDVLKKQLDEQLEKSKAIEVKLSESLALVNPND